MSKSTLTSSLLRTPGITRKLTLSFFAVIMVVALSLPVTLVSLKSIRDASTRAEKSTATMNNVAIFQSNIANARATARDLTIKDNTTLRNKLRNEMELALNAATCIARPSSCAGANLREGEHLSDSEAGQWLAIRDAAGSAKASFIESLKSNNRATALNELDRQMSSQVTTPAQERANSITRSGIEAQDLITRKIATASAMLIGTIIASLLLAAILATFIPRRLMRRLEHLRTVAHRLATGDLEARADEQFARRDDEIGDLISDFNLMAMSLQRNTLELRTAQEQLHIALQQEQERATRDPLTGLRNHRYFQDSLNAEIERCKRSGGQVSIAVLDLDDFKQVNDRFGHSEGDAVLRRATKGISDNLRPYDLACRLGGEEFGVIFPDASAEEAKMVLDRIAEHILAFGPNGERLSFSGGVTTWPVHAELQTELYQRADEAAYTAKMQGKAATVIYDPSKVTSMNSEERSRSRTRDAMLTTATTLVSAVDQKDPYTRHHSELVAIYAATMARAMRLDEATVKLVYRAGLLHDVGKIGIADDILVKGTQLTHDEWVQLRMHPEFSYRILEAAEMEPIATWTRHHHEHFDGTGYPFGLSGDAIPMGSRIVLVADAFESMTSDRVYRRALGQAQAIAELQAGSGIQFDPTVASTMISLVEQGVFTQVMEQYGRAIKADSSPAQMPDSDVPTTSDYEPTQPIAGQAPDNPDTGVQSEVTEPLPSQPRSDAETWAMEQIQGGQWTQEQWNEYQQQLAQQQTQFDQSQWAPPNPDDLAA